MTNKKLPLTKNDIKDITFLATIVIMPAMLLICLWAGLWMLEAWSHGVISILHIVLFIGAAIIFLFAAYGYTKLGA